LSPRCIRVASGVALAVTILADGRLVFLGADIAQRPDKLPLQVPERHAKRLGPGEDYIIMVWPRWKRVE
jgi:hypothetical protein